MFQFFDTIIGFITTLVNVIVSAVEGFIHFTVQMLKGINFLISTIAWLPPFCRGFLFSLVAVCILSALLSFFVDLK